jgi:DNA helicase-2/ATP-dependent DNA helicase PcrA
MIRMQTKLDETTLENAIGNLRVVGDPEDPASSGIHLLNGHLGKGQQFTRVIVVGMEEAFIPNYPAMASGDPQQIRDELAVLHVMASRAQEDLIFTVAQQVPTTSGSLRTREPSRWLPLVEPFATELSLL